MNADHMVVVSRVQGFAIERIDSRGNAGQDVAERLYLTLLPALLVLESADLLAHALHARFELSHLWLMRHNETHSRLS